MKILVTSGGTKIPIDRVRDITNMSRGTFGAKIATELLKMKHEVVFFKAKGSRTPMEMTVDMRNPWGEITETLLKKLMEIGFVRDNYKEYEYVTFDDYADRLKFVIGVEEPDVIVLSAAVSDYGVENFVDGKMRSNNDYQIKLKQLPKLIYHIKEWAPKAKLVGFKMLVNSRDYELIEASKRSIADNKCDMIVANDLQEIRDNKHRVHLVFPEKEHMTFTSDPNDPNYLARAVAEHSLLL